MLQANVGLRPAQGMQPGVLKGGGGGGGGGHSVSNRGYSPDCGVFST